MTNDWLKVRLSDVAIVNPKIPVADIPSDTEVGFISMADVSEDANIVKIQTRTIGDAKKGFTRFQENDVLFAKITPCMENGKGGICLDSRYKLFLGSTEFHVIRAQSKILPMYLHFLLNNKTFREIATAHMVGSAGQKRVPPKFLEQYSFLLPPLNTQQKIADIFSYINEATLKTENLISKAEDLKNGLLNELTLKGIGHKNYKKTKIGEIPQEWELVKLGTIVNHIGSGITPKGGSSVYTASGIPFIRSQNVHFDGLHISDLAFISLEIHNSMKRSHVRNNDVLLNITGASIGRCTIVPTEFPEANVNQHVCIIRVKENLINPEFLKYFLQSTYGQKQIMSLQAGGNRQGLNYEQIKQFYVPLSNDLNEQLEIVNVLISVDKYIQKEKQNKKLYSELKKGLMHDIFNQKVQIN